jgi:hypothetical protein
MLNSQGEHSLRKEPLPFLLHGMTLQVEEMFNLQIEN